MLTMIQMRIACGRMDPPAETASSDLPAPPAMKSLSLEVSEDDTTLFKAQSLTLPRRPLLFLSQDSHQYHFLHEFCAPVTTCFLQLPSLQHSARSRAQLRAERRQKEFSKQSQAKLLFNLASLSTLVDTSWKVKTTSSSYCRSGEMGDCREVGMHEPLFLL